MIILKTLLIILSSHAFCFYICATRWYLSVKCPFPVIIESSFDKERGGITFLASGLVMNYMNES